MRSGLVMEMLCSFLQCFGLVVFFMGGTHSQENRCICSLRDNTELFTYDNERMNLPLPCTYRLTSIKTTDGRCQVTVDLAMTSEEGRSTKPAGMRYLVTTDGSVTGGIIDGRGVMTIDPSLRSVRPMLLSQLTNVDGVKVLAYQDESQSYKLALMECMVSLYFKPEKYLGVYSHNFSTNYSYNVNDLCGDCDGSRNEMDKLPKQLVNNVRSLRDRDAAMLYLTSKHISGGSSKCYEYGRMVKNCPETTTLQALRVCGRVLDSRDPFTKCLLKHTFMAHILETYFNCVNMFCSGSPRHGCRYIHSFARNMLCRLPRDSLCR